MRKFDYSFLKDDKIPSKLVNILINLYTMRNEDINRKDNFNDVYKELEKIATIQSIKGSNAIEGIITSDERLFEIVNRSSAPLNHSEEEISGYRDALNFIHNNYQNIDISEKNILSLHKMMLGYTSSDNIGKYKSTDNAIIEISSDGTRRIRFTPTSALDTPLSMNQLVLAYNDIKNDSSINQLLLISSFILDFLCIHPFSDGNGRMSRLLSLLLLYKAGFDVVKYISFEEKINQTKSYYYESLKNSSLNWNENKNDYFYFIEYFLYTLYTCYKELDNRFLTVDSKKINKSNRIEATILNSILPISKKEISDILPDISITTIELVLSKLLKEDKIIKLGTGRNTKYVRK